MEPGYYILPVGRYDVFQYSNVRYHEFTELDLDHCNYFHYRLDDEENIAGICLSEAVRDPLQRLPEEDVLAFYRAMKAYTNIIYHADNLFKYKMNNGKILPLILILSFDFEAKRGVVGDGGPA